MGKGRRRLVGAALAIAIVGIAIAVGVVWATRSHGSSSITIPPEQPLASYRLVYRVDVAGTTHEEERDISRPFEGRYTERTGSTITAGFLTNSDGAYTWITSGA